MQHQKQGQQQKSINEHEEYLKDHLSDILSFKNTENINELLDKLQNYVEKCGKDVTTHQLRNIFSKIKTSTKKTARELQLIRPHLAYIAARQGDKNDAKRFVQFLEDIIRKVSDDNQVEHFVAFLEAIVAYHKFYHGNKKQ